MSVRLPIALFVALVAVACGVGEGSHATSIPRTAPSVTAPATTATPSTIPDPTAAAAAFERWVAMLAEGDHEGAWEAMAPSSQVALGEELFFDSMVYEMAEGWGSWSAAEDVTYRLEVDENGRTLLWVEGTMSPEGMIETREVAVPVVEGDAGLLVSPFEEFGNVADGVEEELRGDEPPSVPDGSGTGRRVVYSNSDQRVWLVAEDGTVVDAYLVSGKAGVPAPGTYEV